MIYTGQKASEILNINLQEDFKIWKKGYFKEGKQWTAFDNNTGDCFVEQFAKEEEAIAWLENYFEVSEFNDFKIKKIYRGLYYIKDTGFLKIFFSGNKIATKLLRLSFN